MKFSLPQIIAFPNFAEGVIIKPLKNTFKVTSKGMKRLIFKRKHSNFAERKSHHTCPQNIPYNSKTDIILVAKYELFALINSNRIQSAISKSGFPTTESELSDIIQSVLDDIFFEYIKEQSENFSLFDDEDIVQLRLLCVSEVDKVFHEDITLNLM